MVLGARLACIRILGSDNRGMLIPRYSIRTYFVTTVLLAIFCVVLGYAIDGQLWARGVSVGVISAVAAFGMYALLFAIAWFFVEGRAMLQHTPPQSPFVSDEPPKQVLPPVDA
jgi:hypothetical protein